MSDAELDFLRARLEEISAELAEAEASHRQEMESVIEMHLRQTEALRAGEVDRIREIEDLRRELAEQVDEEMARATQLELELKQAQRRIEIIYKSRTWRTGAAIAKVLRPVIRERSTERSAPSVPEAWVRSAPAEADPPPPFHHPLAEEYRVEVESTPDERGAGIGFAVSTVGFDEGRGDLFVATGLGRYLRRRGMSPMYLPQPRWHEMPGSLDWIVAMMPAFKPSLALTGPKILGWARNEIERWLSHDELELFDIILCSSSLAANEIEKVYSGAVAVLPIGVDIELFGIDSHDPDSRVGVVSTVNQWGRERDIYRALRSKPVKFDLRIHGQNVGLSDALVPYHRGQVDYFELPSIYRGTRIVLDDFNHTTVGWGAVNSRLFEALAAGALPITNSRLGLDDLGLSEVPTYNEPTELNPLIQSLLDDSEGTQRLVDGLTQVVKERHSLEVRAHELAEILTRAPEQSTVNRLIAFAPDYRQSNPFQEMLYSGLTRRRTAVFPIEIESFIDDGALSRFQDRECVFHLHWTTPIMTHAATEAEAMIRLDGFLRRLDSFRARGGRFVWTIHNVLPHDSRFEPLEAHLCQELSNRADLVHIMCDATREEIGDLYGLPPGRTVTVAHSSYAGVYPDAAGRELSRARFGFGSDDVVLLALGGIRRYKGLDRFLEAFDRASTREPRLRLIVAGKTGIFEGLADLKEELEAHPRIIANFNEVLPTDLQYFYAAADVAVMPHQRVLNSGALLLAYTFGVPVIAPRVGCLAELLVEGAALGFDADSAESLEEAIVSAPSLANSGARRAAREIADSRPIEEMSSRFLEALDGLF